MSIFQTPEWEKFKLETGWQKSYRIDGVLVLQKNLPFKRTMLYSPRVDKYQVSSIKNQEFLEKIREIADINNAIFYRLEIDDLKNQTENYKLTAQPDRQAGNSYIKSFEEMQPEHTIILDISKDEEEILAQMKQKGRYNIKVAAKHDVRVKEVENIDNFFSLYEKMAKRQKITFRDKAYFQNLIDNLSQKDYLRMFEARVDKNVLAAAIIVYFDKEAIYLFGGSSDEMKQAMAPYKLHWEIIKDAKAAGFKEYDFFGVAPEDQPNHPWAGVTSFKKKFGGQYKELVGSYDLVFKPLEYKLFKLAERLRR